MSKNFKQDIANLKEEMNMDSLYAGVSAGETKKVETTQPKKTGRPKSVASDTKDFKKVNGANKYDNYTYTIKIDALYEEYLKKVEWIKFIEERETYNKNSYINKLIRDDLIKLLKLKNNASDQDIYDKWQDYKKANNI